MHCGCATDGACNTIRCHLSGMKDLKVSGCTDLTKSRTLKTHLIFLTPPVVWAAFSCIRDDNCRRQACLLKNLGSRRAFSSCESPSYSLVAFLEARFMRLQSAGLTYR